MPLFFCKITFKKIPSNPTPPKGKNVVIKAHDNRQAFRKAIEYGDKFWPASDATLEKASRNRVIE